MTAEERLRQHWLVAMTSRRLRGKPIAATILGTPLVFFRHSGGVAAMLDRCPHRNAPLAAGKVVGNSIQCPYHGWQFNAQGQCNLRPGCSSSAVADSAATGSVPVFPVLERDGLIWVSLNQTPERSSPRQSVWATDSRFSCFHWSDEIDSDFVDALENLLDATHTPFVHRGLLRSESNPQRFRATVRVGDDWAEAEYLDEGKQSGWISKIFERDRGSSFGRFIPPCTAELEYGSTRQTEFVLNSHFTPLAEGKLQVVSTFFIRRSRVPMMLKKGLLTPFFRRILQQDATILKLQQENIRRFDGPEYIYWDGDLLRGLIDSWFRTGQFPSGFGERDVELEL